MRMLSVALGLGVVFTAAAALAEEPIIVTPKPTKSLCIAVLEPRANLTHCEYRLPGLKEVRVDNGRTLISNGAKSFTSKPIPGLDAKLCANHFEETQKIHGPCRKVSW